MTRRAALAGRVEPTSLPPPSVRWSLVTAAVGWLLVAATCYWQVPMAARFGGYTLLVDVGAWLLALSMSTAAVPDVWRRWRTRGVALLIAGVLLAVAAIVVTPWEDLAMRTRFLLSRSEFAAVGKLSCEPSGVDGPSSYCDVALPPALRHLSATGAATVVRAGNGQSVLYFPVLQGAGPREPFTWTVRQQYYFHVDGPINPAVWRETAEDGAYLGARGTALFLISQTSERWSLGDGWWWTS